MKAPLGILLLLGVGVLALFGGGGRQTILGPRTRPLTAAPQPIAGTRADLPRAVTARPRPIGGGQGRAVFGTSTRLAPAADAAGAVVVDVQTRPVVSAPLRFAPAVSRRQARAVERELSRIQANVAAGRSARFGEPGLGGVTPAVRALPASTIGLDPLFAETFGQF